MTHDELLVKIETMLETRQDCYWFFHNALRAVVELHKPYLTKDNRQFCSNHCERSIDDSYPCPTIQAIEKELK